MAFNWIPRTEHTYFVTLRAFKIHTLFCHIYHANRNYFIAVVAPKIVAFAIHEGVMPELVRFDFVTTFATFV